MKIVEAEERRLFLASSSYVSGKGYLEHCIEAMVNFLGSDIKTLCFIPFAAVAAPKDQKKVWAEYTEKPKQAFAKFGIEVCSAHEHNVPYFRVKQAEALFIGGGNTFHLLYYLYELGLVEAIRENYLSGIPIMGVSAGTNVLCPTIMNTNDMPIMEVLTLEAAGLLNFQINPHYIDPGPKSAHQGETRPARIAEYHKINTLPVLGLREGSWLRYQNGKLMLEGATGAKMFCRNLDPFEYSQGCDLTIHQTFHSRE